MNTKYRHGSSAMTFYSYAHDPMGHVIRIALMEKEFAAEIYFLRKGEEMSQRISDINPYRTKLLLVDRELTLYNSQVILEYLDERFPHPPLMPVDPISRANNRQLRDQLAKDLFDPLSIFLSSSEKKNKIPAALKRRLMDNLTATTTLVHNDRYLASEDFSLADCYMTSLFWRLEQYGITIPSTAQRLQDYTARLFAREAFKKSLSDMERQANKPL